MPTALVTGASSGIGAAFAVHLATRGYHLVLVARDAERLAEQQALLISRGAPAAVEVLVADLTVPAQLNTVAHRLEDSEQPVDLLINNAGKALGMGFTEAGRAEVLDQLALNVTAVLVLTHAALPGMTVRGHGGIINVASIAGLLPGRGSTYSASKAWVIAFSEGLAVACQGSGVRVQALCPGFVRTQFHQRAGIDMSSKKSWMYVDVDTLVATSMADLRANRMLSIPGRLYRGIAMAAKLAPRSLVRTAANKVDSRRT